MKKCLPNENIKEFQIDENSNGEVMKVQKDEEVIRLDLVPGSLHVNISSIIGNLNHDMDEIDSFYIAIEEKEEGLVGIREIKKETLNSCNEYFNVMVNNIVTMKIHLYAKCKDTKFEYSQAKSIITLERKLKKIGMNKTLFDVEDLKKIHNNLTSVDYKISKKLITNPFKKLLDLFEPNLPNIYGFQAQICYTSTDEADYIESDYIKNLDDLKKWLDMRENSYKQFFNGYINLKGQNIKFATYLWKRRFIQWNGYNFILYNVDTQEEIGKINFKKNINTISVHSIDISDRNFLKDNLIKIYIDNGILELHFDNIKAYERCLSAAVHLFGTVHKIKNW